MPEYHEIFEKIPDGVVIHEPETGAIVDTNEQFCTMLGYRREELLELKFAEIHWDEPPYSAEHAEELVRRAAIDGTQSFEWMTETKTGEPLPVEVHLRETTIKGEKRVLAVVRDITERKQRQQELELQNERLERFASIVSHDLRNPLNVAQGRLELAREASDNEHLETIERAHTRMETLIGDLLVLAREGTTAMDSQSVELASRATTAWANVTSDGSTLVVEGEKTIRADPRRLDQLFENLFRNSIEHGGPDDSAVSDGGVDNGDEGVTVTVGLTDDGFYVEDDGPGVPPEKRALVFEPGHTTSANGTGFGLSIVSEIVSNHGWEIHLTESESGGARFEMNGVEFVE
ncbi:two-component system sensor histidine kinase NtrB [Haloferax sp. DFSO60]|uniref:two-component system sensor histidine kinase NtrB n=1 Tax=Haloferax sp. DFSO60 TaxID=3388652 RepID=UPI003978AD4D